MTDVMELQAPWRYDDVVSVDGRRRYIVTLLRLR